MGKATVHGIGLDLIDRGAGRPILFLHDELGLDPGAAHLERLAAARRLLAPSLPGFGDSDLPDWIDSVDDLSYVCLDLLDSLDLPSVDLVGCSFGGWVAAELATKAPERIRRMALCAPYGVKTGPADRLDIPDLFALSAQDLARLSFHAPARAAVIPAALSQAEAMAIARNRETFALLGWEPFLHNPKLRHRLSRVTVPTLFLRGESDGIVSADYLSAYADLLPDARVAHIPQSGHFPHIETPEAFASRVLAFLCAEVAPVALDGAA